MIGRIQSQSAWSGSAHAVSPRSVRQTSHSSSEAQQSGVLQVKTDEGDIVTISFAAAQKSRSDSRQAVSSHGYAASSRSESSSSLSVGVQVQGSLSDKEVADIGELMQHLGAAITDARSGDSSQFAADVAAAGAVDSVQGFQFAYQESTRAESSSSTRMLM